jgi:uncharacterized protein (DUF58 family)
MIDRRPRPERQRRPRPWRGRFAPAWLRSAQDAAPSQSPPRREYPAELLRRLEFKVLRRLDGYLFGDQTGRFYGPSLDLAEVREYQPGDEVRRIDWSVTARTGVVHVRQYREEREVVAWLVVDRTPSMGFGTRRLSKGELALEFSGVVAAVIARAGKVGAVSFGADGVRATPLGGGRRQALAVLDHLMAPPDRAATEARSHRPSDLAEALERLQRTLRRRALVFVVSDFLAGVDLGGIHEPAWSEPLGTLALRHDVVAVRMVDPAERALTAMGEVRLRDLESSEEIWLDSDDPRVRREYARLVEGRERSLERAFRAAAVDTLELSTHLEVLGPLLHFARRRAGRRA